LFDGFSIVVQDGQLALIASPTLLKFDVLTPVVFSLTYRGTPLPAGVAVTINQTAGDFSGLASSATTNSFGQFLSQIKPLKVSATPEDTLNVSAKVFNKTSNQVSFVIYQESSDITIIDIEYNFYLLLLEEDIFSNDFVIESNVSYAYITGFVEGRTDHPTRLHLNGQAIADPQSPSDSWGQEYDIFLPFKLNAGDTLTVSTNYVPHPIYDGISQRTIGKGRIILF
jgi:hypothetical protein